jgi:hypothetical protein
MYVDDHRERPGALRNSQVAELLGLIAPLDAMVRGIGLHFEDLDRIAFGSGRGGASVWLHLLGGGRERGGHRQELASREHDFHLSSLSLEQEIDRFR